MCEVAATKFGLDPTYRGTSADDELTAGCIAPISTSKAFSFIDDFSLSRQQAKCTATYSQYCICAVAPDCTNVDGVTLNEKECLCATEVNYINTMGLGRQLCTTKTGLGCDATNGQCIPTIPCTKTDGLESNNLACICNGTPCSDTSGFFCNTAAAINKCRNKPPCSKTNGELNDVPCICGSVECDDTTGKYSKTYCDITYEKTRHTSTGIFYSRSRIVDCSFL